MEGKVQLPTFFSDNMVLQQQTNINLWGKATPNQSVEITVSWNKEPIRTMADLSGNWRVSLPTPIADGMEHQLEFNDGELTIVNNVLLGEVWLCSGQSNMEMPMKGFKNQPIDNSTMAVVRSKNKEIRMFTVKRNSTIDLQNDLTGDWQLAAPASTGEFSATAYYFGKLLNETLEVPVGLIVSSWGGSSVEAWMDSQMLQSFTEVKLPKEATDIKEKNRTPTTLYNAMINPLVGYTMKGLIWYQGESNYDRAHSYTQMFTNMIQGWRNKWNQGAFPVYYAQIAPYDYSLVTAKGKEVINSAYLREAQAAVELHVENTGMAVLMDAGMEKCIHPSDKRVVGERLGLQALAKTYQLNGVNADSPIFKEFEVKNDTLIVSFERSGMWVTAPKGKLTNFEVAGEDKLFYPATAWIERSKVLVKSERVKKPVAVRYGFKNFVEGDLFGTEGLPVSSFRSDNW